jgi:hypothetical protein
MAGGGDPSKADPSEDEGPQEDGPDALPPTEPTIARGSLPPPVVPSESDPYGTGSDNPDDAASDNPEDDTP